MLSEEEKRFMHYWELNRGKKAKLYKQLLISLPVGIVLIIAIFVNFFSGWYKRAQMVSNASPSLFVVLFIAAILIVAFLTLFSARHKYDTFEKRYQELLLKERKSKTPIS